MMKNVSFILLFLALSLTLNAQTFQIRATSKGGGVIGIELRETSGLGTPTTANFFTDLVFGLKWLSTYNVSLLSPSGGYNIGKSGVEMTQGAYKFQAYQASNTPFSLPTNWTTNTWVEIATVSNSQNGLQATGVFEICEPGFNATTNPNIGIDLTDYTPTINGSAVNVVLPVEILTFTAKEYNRTGVLDWQTDNEMNLDHFEIEQSNDGYKFQNIGTVKKNSKQEYRFIDKQPFGGTTYYRLKMVENTGDTKLSNIQPININTPTKIKIYPNPTSSEMTIDYQSENRGEVNIQILDLLGKVILQKHLSVEKGQTLIPINLSEVADGIYNITIENQNQKFSEKISVVK